MAKDTTVRSRVDEMLLQRMEAYLKTVDARVRSMDKSSLIREALVEYLNKRQGVTGAFTADRDRDNPERLNEDQRPPQSKVDAAGRAGLKKAVEMVKDKTDKPGQK